MIDNKMYRVSKDGVLLRAVIGGEIAIIPDGVTAIGGGAFLDNIRVKTVIIPASVREIDSMAFVGCFQLETIVINNPYSEIGAGAFECTAWYRAQQGDYVMLGSILYRYRGKETYLALPRGISAISGGVLEYPRSIDSIEIPDGVQLISNNAFASTRLQRVVIADSVKYIGHHAFHRCAKLREVKMPRLLEHLGERAFEKCAVLEKISTLGKIKRLQYGTFMGCRSLTGLTSDEGLEIIEEYALSSCKSLTALTLPSSLRSIQRLAFNLCDSLNSITLPENMGCQGIHKLNREALLNVYLYGSLNCGRHIISGLRRDIAKRHQETFEDIINKGNGNAVHKFFALWNEAYPEDYDKCAEKSARAGKAEVTAAVIECKRSKYPPEKLRKYLQEKEDKALGVIPYTLSDYKRMFRWTVGENGITITKYIGEDTAVKVPESISNLPVVAIGDNAFMGQEDLEVVVLPKSVKSLGARAFACCKSLYALHAAAPLETLEYEALCGCSSLVDLPDIAESARMGIAILKYTGWSEAQGDFAVFRNKLIQYNGVAAVAVVPEGVEVVEARAVMNSLSLEKIVFPDTLKEVAQEAFAACYALKEVEFVAPVSFIGVSAFAFCTDLKKVVLPNKVDEIQRNAFNMCSNDLTFYVPKNGGLKPRIKSIVGLSKAKVEEI